jgi:hypothetical protein
MPEQPPDLIDRRMSCPGAARSAASLRIAATAREVSWIIPQQVAEGGALSMAGRPFPAMKHKSCTFAKLACQSGFFPAKSSACGQ